MVGLVQRKNIFETHIIFIGVFIEKYFDGKFDFGKESKQIERSEKITKKKSKNLDNFVCCLMRKEEREETPLQGEDESRRSSPP